MERTGLGRPEQRPDHGRFVPAFKIGRHQGVLKAKILAVVALLAAALPFVPQRAQGYALDSGIVTDPATGAALMGYDVVSYYIDNRAVPGNPTRQVSHAGRAWYFASEANREAFLGQPEAFQPAFGGYDAVAIAAGVLRSGNPRVFLRHAGRLYFFRDEEARERAAQDPEILAAARREWPILSRDLDP